MDSKKNVLLFHGSKADFKQFNHDYVGSGENAGPGVGFHFTDSLKGAAAHADRYVKGDGEPLVYVCTLKESANIIERSKAPSKHEQNIKELWNKKLPFSCHNLFESSDWFNDLELHYSKILVKDCQVEKLDGEKCFLLKQAGFDVIRNYEAGFEDAYLHGDVILVLNPTVITVVEKLSVVELWTEVCGPRREYILSNSKAALGASNVLSYLRRAI